MEVEVKPELEALFSTLQADLSEALHPWQYGHLKDTFSEAFTRVQHTFARVVSWLHLEDPSDTQVSFSLTQILDIAVKSAMQPLQGFEPNLQILVDEGQSMGADVLKVLSDILFIVLDNVAKHAQLPLGPQIDVYASFDSKVNMLEITVESQVGPSVRSTEVDNNLERIRRLIENGNYKSHVSLEGGSGFIKLKRIVSSYRSHSLDFGFMDNGQFFVKAGIPIVFQTPLAMSATGSNLELA